MIRGALQNRVPDICLEYCCGLWRSYPFHFKVTARRETKLGDYRYHYGRKSHTITINGDLNPYSFLVTYLHEVAHLRTQVIYGSNVKPHGNEWKTEFKKLLQPVMVEAVFPESILHALRNYLLNPKASSCTDLNLLKALSEFDKGRDYYKFLSEISQGQTFRFNRKFYVKESIVRTRALCREVKSGRRFYISEGAQVELVQMSLF